MGAGTYYLYNRLRRASCSGYSCCYGCSNSCYGRGKDDTCQMSMNNNLYRDDLLAGTGFYPSEEKPYPLKLRITQVSGDGYSVSSVCPPPDCTTQDCGGGSGDVGDLFVTLTELENLGESGGQSGGQSAGQTRYVSGARQHASVAVCTLLACALVPAAAALP